MEECFKGNDASDCSTFEKQSYIRYNTKYTLHHAEVFVHSMTFDFDSRHILCFCTLMFLCRLKVEHTINATHDRTHSVYSLCTLTDKTTLAT